MFLEITALWHASSAILASILSFEKLIDDGSINNNGIPLNDQMIQLSDTMPPIKPENLLWAHFKDVGAKETMFHYLKQDEDAYQMTDWLMCNSAIELERATFSLYPKLVPIGPLLASNRLADQT